MINKSENIISSAMVSVDAPSSSIQSLMGNLVAITNTSNTPISALPPEMIYHLGSFLNLKDKVSLSQAFIDAGLAISLDYKEILREFNNQFLTQKINILLGDKKQKYDFSMFYTLEAQNEKSSTGIYSLLFNEMCDDFRQRRTLSENIAALVETLDFASLDAQRVKSYVDREEPNEEKDLEELINYLFPTLTDSEIRKEIEYRIQLFDTRDEYTRTFSFCAEKVTDDLLLFLKMEKQYRGIPIELVKRTQKLANSHLHQIIQKANETIQAMPTEAVRMLLIMAIDESQREDFCEKMIEFGTKDNLFYCKSSPYFHMLKSDLLYRIDLTEPKMGLFSAYPRNHQVGKPSMKYYEVYKCYVAYYADGAYLREHIDNLMNSFLEIQIKNGEDPVSENHYGNLLFWSPYHLHIQSFYNRMEKEHGMEKSLEEVHKSRLSHLKETSLYPNADEIDIDSPEYVFNCVARNEISLYGLMVFLNKNPDHINAQNLNGDTLLHLFIKLGILDVVRILVNLGADLNIKNNEGFSPLILAVQSEDMHILGFLLKLQDLDVNQPDSSGNTALHHAIMSNKIMAMHRLLRHEATDKTIANDDGKKPCDLSELAGLSSSFHLSLA